MKSGISVEQLELGLVPQVFVHQICSHMNAAISGVMSPPGAYNSKACEICVLHRFAMGMQRWFLKMRLPKVSLYLFCYQKGCWGYWLVESLSLLRGACR